MSKQKTKALRKLFVSLSNGGRVTINGYILFPPAAIDSLIWVTDLYGLDCAVVDFTLSNCAELLHICNSLPHHER